MSAPVYPVLAAKNLTKVFESPSRVEVLKGVSLEIYPGEAVAIMGASGEGKSTLLNILGTLEKPTDGQVTFFPHHGSKKSHERLRNQELGFIFQGFHLLEDFTVLDNVLMPAQIGRKKIRVGSSSFIRATKLLEEVGLAHRGAFLTKVLSGGEKQRVAIARALCNDPAIVLADEPSGNLDHKTSQGIYDLLLSTTKGKKKALVVVTHDQELASLCDRILHLQDGVLC
jgi:lipoprotein-releasing system ATP-binding protein